MFYKPLISYSLVLSLILSPYRVSAQEQSSRNVNEGIYKFGAAYGSFLKETLAPNGFKDLNEAKTVAERISMQHRAAFSGQRATVNLLDKTFDLGLAGTAILIPGVGTLVSVGIAGTVQQYGIGNLNERLDAESKKWMASRLSSIDPRNLQGLTAEQKKEKLKTVINYADIDTDDDVANIAFPTKVWL
jgi:hypothetical protein